MDVALVILDGWGLGPADDPDHRNAVARANTPTVDRLMTTGASGRLSVTGRDVGLPAGQMGNSEVGHLNIGAGRVVYQEYTRINDAMAAADLAGVEAGGRGEVPDPSLDENDAIDRAFTHVEATGGRLHLLGLVSDGGVHSDYRHLFGLIDLAARRDIEAVTHAFTDGRDTDPTGGIDYLADLESVISTHETGDIGTVVGRYYAMDRDQNWERTHSAYEAIVTGSAAYLASDAHSAISNAYDRNETDEFVEPTVIEQVPRLQDGDAIIFTNFRADRARQLTRMLADIQPEDWQAEGITTDPPSTAMTTMTSYDRTFDIPVAFDPIQPKDTLGEVLAAEGLTQLRIAESEKYAHVTYFLNGGREIEFPGEQRRIIQSPDVPTYDQAPEMSAAAVTDEAIDVIETDDPDVMVLNYANPDMVGHTGDFDAAVTAVETVDTQLGRLLDGLTAAGSHSIVTADHGNADDMGSAEHPHTAHTHNDVPFLYLAPTGDDGGMAVREGGILADIAPTMLSLLDHPKPTAMTGRSLLVDD